MIFIEFVSSKHSFEILDLDCTVETRNNRTIEVYKSPENYEILTSKNQKDYYKLKWIILIHPKLVKSNNGFSYFAFIPMWRILAMKLWMIYG